MHTFPLQDLTIIDTLKRKYILTHTIAQAVLFANIGEDWIKSMLVDMYRFNMCACEWCSLFDGIWFNVEHQLEDGFITLLNPESPQKVVCVSTLYNGDYFIMISCI